jgi:hypothetical protein
MKFGIFYEHQLPRPWEDGSELQLFQDALLQVELADRLGIDHAWEVEHLPEANRRRVLTFRKMREIAERA